MFPVCKLQLPEKDLNPTVFPQKSHRISMDAAPAAPAARSSLAEPPVEFGGGFALKGELGHGASGRVCLGAAMMGL
jgi:hypothetical protein